MASLIISAGCTMPQSGPAIVAHRGASWYAPENTIPAFLLAWEQGADAIEGDFFLTADGEIVCIHDRRTGRVSETDIEVSRSTVEELRKLDVGAWKGDQWRGTVIPTLAEVFEIVPPGKKFLIEVKSGTEILPKLYEELDKSSLEKEQIVLISFNSDVIREFKLARPGYNAYWLSGFKENESGGIVPGVEEVLEILSYNGADGFSSNYRIIDRSYIDRITGEGYEYHVWTVNDPEVALRFREYGAYSITTDRPGFIREHLDSACNNESP